MQSRSHIGRAALVTLLAVAALAAPADARRHVKTRTRPAVAAAAPPVQRPAGYSRFDVPFHEIHEQDYRTASVVESSSVRAFGPTVRVGWEMVGGEVDGSVREMSGRIRVHGSLRRLFERLAARPAVDTTARPGQ